MIPKKIYQTWIYKNLPFSVNEIIKETMELNPSYTHELYDDADCFYFIKENYGKQVASAYETLNIGVAKADLWRYAVLYKYGGIYLDIDSKITSNLDSLVMDDDIAIISREGNPNIFVQWCLMFDKNHPILEKTLKKCVYNILNKKTQNVYELTGPILFSNAIKETLIDLNLDLYNTDDSIINEKMKNKNFNKFKTKFYSIDYKGYCEFKHKDNEDLYKTKKHWKIEVQSLSVFK